MKAHLLHSYGPSARFSLEPMPKPTLGPIDVLVRISASSVNVADVKARELGHLLDFVPPLPAVLGIDFAGYVEQVGAAVTDLAVGDEVYGCAGGVAGNGGALADLIAADRRLLARKPRTLSMIEAAALPLVSITAWEALFDRAAIKPAESVLIQGGLGGVGHIAVQLARCAGATVYATHSPRKPSEQLATYGAIPIDYEAMSPAEYVTKYTDGIGFDMVFDTVGSKNIHTAFESARISGRVATTVSLTEIDLSLAHTKGLTLHVIYMLIPLLHGKGRKRHRRILESLAKVVDGGLLMPTIDSVFGFSDVEDAYRRLSSGDVIGKVVISHGF